MLQNHTESHRERVRRNQYNLQDEAVATAAAIQNRKAKPQQQPPQKKTPCRNKQQRYAKQ